MHSLAMGLLLALTGAALADAAVGAKTADAYTALTDITLAAENHGYHLVKIQPIDQALVKRGYDDPGLKILFLGNAEEMEQAGKTDPLLLSLLPLRLMMFRKDGQVVISSDDLEAWKVQFSSPASLNLIEKWQQDLTAILGDFAGR
jgi:uncharacterized protein (DUF302 family)